METVALWFLFVMHRGATFSPPMATAEECQRVLQVLTDRILYQPHVFRCVQINVVKERK